MLILNGLTTFKTHQNESNLSTKRGIRLPWVHKHGSFRTSGSTEGFPLLQESPAALNFGLQAAISAPTLTCIRWYQTLKDALP